MTINRRQGRAISLELRPWRQEINKELGSIIVKKALKRFLNLNHRHVIKSFQNTSPQ